MSEPVTITVKWYSGTGGPSEIDLMRALNELVNVYRVDVIARFEPADDEIARAVNWLNAKHGGGGA